MKSETLLMVDLTKAEEMLIKRLIRSFEVKAKSLKKKRFQDYTRRFHKKDICLIIVHVYQDRTRNIKKIRQIKKLITIPVPLLVLVENNLSSDIHRYVNAGADDYIVMPLNEDSFAMRFYVLLECGQAILQSGEVNQQNQKTPNITMEKKVKNDLFRKKSNHWNLILGYLQEGLSFFSPKSQFTKRIGTPIFNKWELVRKLATGGDGTIWLVRELGKDREAVAKIPHSQEMNINSLRAAAVLKRLVYHPNIVHLIEVVKEDEKFILIQEYVEGVTLTKLLASHISSRQKEAVFLQLLSVIAYSHSHKIMHRDIKPDNIMVKPDGRLKLLDFGSAKEIAWRDQNSCSCGTLNFMPQEQMEGKACLASDVWALGVTLYLLTLNRLPLYQDNSWYPMDIEIKMVILPPHKIRSDIPFKLEQIIMKCLEQDPEKRYKNASELQDDLLEKLPDFGNGRIIPDLDS